MLRYIQGQKPPLGSFINWSHPLANGLVGCWIFNEGTGDTVNDLTLNRNNGTIYGAVWQDNGLYLDGNDVIEIPYSSSLDITGAITVFTLTNISSLSPVHQYIVDRWTYTSGNYRAWALNLDYATLTWRASVNGYDSGAIVVAYDFTGYDNQPVSIGGTYDGSSELKLYINGLNVANNTGLSSIVSTTQPVYIGAGDTGLAYPLTGTIYYTYIYNRALSADEIRWLHADPYAFITSPMRFYDLEVPAPPAGRISRYHSLSGLGGQGQMTWDPLG